VYDKIYALAANDFEEVNRLNEKISEQANRDKETLKGWRIPLNNPPDAGKSLCSKSLWHRLKLQRDDLYEIQEVIKFHCPEFDTRDIMSKIDDHMNQINQDIKSNYEIWKAKIVNELYGDQYKSRMEKRIIDNDEL